MKIQRDKLTHIAYGVPVAALAAALAFVAMHLGAHPMAAALIAAGAVSGMSVEGVQWADNRRARAAGLPLPHEISGMDAVASAAPCWALAVVVQLVMLVV